MPGLGPAAEALLFRQKGRKPFLPVHGPYGKLRHKTKLNGSGTRSEKSNLVSRRSRAQRRNSNFSNQTGLKTIYIHVGFKKCKSTSNKIQKITAYVYCYIHSLNYVWFEVDKNDRMIQA